MDGLSIKPTVIQVHHSLLCILFITELQQPSRHGLNVTEDKSHRLSSGFMLNNMATAAFRHDTYLDIHISY